MPELNDMTPSEQIKAIRAKTGLSQVKFAAQFGVPKRTLEHWESGTRVPPDYVLKLLDDACEKRRITMTTHTIYRLGQLYRALTDATRPHGANDAEYQNALHRPLTEITKAINLAHQLHVMTPELDCLCASVLGDVSPEDIMAERSCTGLTLPQQGTFSLGYATRKPVEDK